jgi:hypothetical protein
VPRRATLSTVVSRSRAAHLPHPDTQAGAFVMRLLHYMYEASPSRCDDRRTSRSLSDATRHTLFGRLDLARVRGHVELAWAEAGDDVTPFIHRSLWPAGGLIVAILHVSKVCAAALRYCTVQESRKGAKGRGKIGGRPRLPRTRASLLTGRTCDW